MEAGGCGYKRAIHGTLVVVELFCILTGGGFVNINMIQLYHLLRFHI